jgi:hypothetical protein
MPSTRFGRPAPIATRIAVQRKTSQSSGRHVRRDGDDAAQSDHGRLHPPEPAGEQAAEMACEPEGDRDDEELQQVVDDEDVREEPVARRLHQRQEPLGRQQLFHRSSLTRRTRPESPPRCDGDTLAGLPRGWM